MVERAARILSLMVLAGLALPVAPVLMANAKPDAPHVTARQIEAATNPMWLAGACRQFVSDEDARLSEAVAVHGSYMPPISLRRCAVTGG